MEIYIETPTFLSQAFFIFCLQFFIACRCQSSLQTKHGPRTWREKIPDLVLVQPWEIPLIEDESGLQRSQSSSASLSEQGELLLRITGTLR